MAIKTSLTIEVDRPLTCVGLAVAGVLSLLLLGCSRPKPQSVIVMPGLLQTQLPEDFKRTNERTYDRKRYAVVGKEYDYSTDVRQSNVVRAAYFDFLVRYNELEQWRKDIGQQLAQESKFKRLNINQLRRINGQGWIVTEAVFEGEDGPVRHRQYATSHEGHALLFVLIFAEDELARFEEVRDLTERHLRIID